MERVKSTFQVYRTQGLENDELVAVRLDLISDSLSSLVFVLLRVETIWGKGGGGALQPGTEARIVTYMKGGETNRLQVKIKNCLHYGIQRN